VLPLAPDPDDASDVTVVLLVVMTRVVLLTHRQMEVDEALGKLGIIGRWQILHYTMVGIAFGFSPCFYMLAIIYIGKCVS